MYKSAEERFSGVMLCLRGNGKTQADKIRRSEMGYESKIKNRAADDLFDAIMSIEDLDECYKFFSDLCTVKEIRAMAQRYGVAKLLLDKKTYSEIEEATGASTATISRINRTLQYGADGYISVIERMKEEE